MFIRLAARLKKRPQRPLPYFGISTNTGQDSLAAELADVGCLDTMGRLDSSSGRRGTGPGGVSPALLEQL